MTKTQQITKLTYRLFLFAWILAVLWVKGYLWLIFTITALLLLLDGYLAAQLAAATANRSQSGKARSMPSGRRAKGADAGDKTSWREPMPKWTTPPGKE